MEPKKKARIGQEANATSGVADDSLLNTAGEGSCPAITLPGSSIPEQTTPVSRPAEGTTIPPIDTHVSLPAHLSVLQGDSTSSRVNIFLQLDPSVFMVANPEDDHQDYIYEMYKTLRVMRAIEINGVDLAAYHLKGVAYSCFKLWEDSREEGSPPARWSEFSDAYIDHFLPTETRVARAAEFENLKQGSRSMWEYHMEFARLSKYAIHMFPTMEASVRLFVRGLNPLTINEASTTALKLPTAEASPDVVIGILTFQSHDVYALIDPGSTLSYVTTFVAMEFGIEPDQLHEPFLVSTLVGESITAARVYRGCVVMVRGRDTIADLVELWMVDFDVIMGMDWIYSCFFKLDCRTRTIRLEFPNEPVVEWKGDNLVRITDTNTEAPSLESVAVANEFPDVFPDELPRSYQTSRLISRSM
ncbi:uncharacterized protein [Nicotiana sylvestris]|uniref:uncharacterized protein n=1 Tax=Nicotiana sylvestris TaxID=4096 RepID=UPI00388C6B8D